MSWMQVPYGFQLSGENLPPFGCALTDNTTEPLNRRSVSFIYVTLQSVLIPT